MKKFTHPGELGSPSQGNCRTPEARAAQELLTAPMPPRLVELHKMVNRSTGAEGTDQAAVDALRAYIRGCAHCRRLLEAWHYMGTDTEILALADADILALADVVRDVAAKGWEVLTILDAGRLKMLYGPVGVPSGASPCKPEDNA